MGKVEHIKKTLGELRQINDLIYVIDYVKKIIVCKGVNGDTYHHILFFNKIYHKLIIRVMKLSSTTSFY